MACAIESSPASGGLRGSASILPATLARRRLLVKPATVRPHDAPRTIAAGLPLVAARWLLIPGADVQAISHRLHRALDDGLRMGIDDGTNGAVYYRIDDRDMRGLDRFHQEALTLGLCEPGITPAYFDGSAPSDLDTTEKEVSP